MTRPTALLAAGLLLAAAASAHARDAIAVFAEPNFPYYIATPEVTPEFVAQCLRQAGVEWEFLSADGLADPTRLNTERFVALVHVYGNSFPVAAADNLRAFHQAGGCVVAVGGVPYCHPCVREGGKWVDKIAELGFDFIGHNRIGTGYWGETRDVNALVEDPNAPFALAFSHLPSPSPGVVQFPVAREDGDVLRPILSVVKDGQRVGHPVAVIEHHCKEFPGAIDVWLGATLAPAFSLQQYERIITAACLWVLRAKGRIEDGAYRSGVASVVARYVEPNATPVPRGRPFLKRAPAPAEELMVLDVSALPPDEGLLVSSLQGVVNRKQPRLYLLNQLADTHWLDLITQSGHRARRVEELSAVVAAFRAEVAGAVVYDPAQPHQINVATTVAGARDVVMATADLAERFGLPVVEDLRGRFATPVEGYEWAIGRFWPELDHRVIACMCPSWIAPRDYIIQSRAFTFWLDADVAPNVPADQRLFFERLLARMPAQGYVLGWWQEGDGGIGEWAGVATSSRYGKITVCTVGAENLSVHSGLDMPSGLRQKPIEFGDVDKRIYVSFLLSDGDNFSMDLYSVIERAWHEGARGRVPLGWGLCPTQVELTPLAVRHWYETASASDLFVCMDGLGYIYPTYYGQALGAGDPYGEFLDRTAGYMRELDMRHLWFLDGSNHVGPMVERLKPDGLFCEYGVPATQRQEVHGDTAAIWVDVNPWEKPYDTVDAYVQAIRKRTPDTRPAFLLVGVNGFTIGPDKIARILRDLGPDYVAVRPDELCHLLRTYRTEGVNPNPRPRAPLDLSTVGDAPFEPTRNAEGWWVVDEVRGTPDIGGWFTAPGGTAWVRKRVAIHPPGGATEAAARLFVSGRKGQKVLVVVNGHEHRAELGTSGWQWLRGPIPVADLTDGENEIRYTGNPDARLGTAGYSGVDFDHSDFGSPDHWTSLDGELACIVEMR